MVILTLLIFRLMKELESVLLIEMECSGMIMCIYHKKTASGLVVLVGKPVFENIENLSANISATSLEMLINTKTPYKYSRIATSTLGIADTTIKSVGCGATKMRCLYTVVGDGEEPNNSMRQLSCQKTVCFSK